MNHLSWGIFVWRTNGWRSILVDFYLFPTHPMKELVTTMFWQYTSTGKHDTEVVSHQPANQTNTWLFLVRWSLLFVVPEAPRHQRCHSVDVAWIFWIDGWLDATETLRLSWGQTLLDSKLMLFSIWACSEIPSWTLQLNGRIPYDSRRGTTCWIIETQRWQGIIPGSLYLANMSGRFFCRLCSFWKGLVCLEGIFWWIEGCRTHVSIILHY